MCFSSAYKLIIIKSLKIICEPTSGIFCQLLENKIANYALTTTEIISLLFFIKKEYVSTQIKNHTTT